MIVIDTNVVLDLLVFNDPACATLKQALADGQHRWIATLPMREELARVLAYPKIVLRLAFYQRSADEVLAQFDRHAQIVPVAPRASVRCTDADDQCFIDLAVQHQALLLSKDGAVLSMAKRLAALGCQASSAIVFDKIPMPSTSISHTSPGAIHTGGVRA
jgi:putative PIN family toxin of toxin-antitoxin system